MTSTRTLATLKLLFNWVSIVLCFIVFRQPLWLVSWRPPVCYVWCEWLVSSTATQSTVLLFCCCWWQHLRSLLTGWRAYGMRLEMQNVLMLTDCRSDGSIVLRLRSSSHIVQTALADRQSSPSTSQRSTSRSAASQVSALATSRPIPTRKRCFPYASCLLAVRIPFLYVSQLTELSANHTYTLTLF